MELLKDPLQLDETESYDDLLWADWETEALWEFIEKIPNKSLLGVVWPYWVGKSSALKQIANSMESWNSKSKWLYFEAWKYPDRKELWEMLIIELTSQLIGWCIDSKGLKIKKTLKELIKNIFSSSLNTVASPDKIATAIATNWISVALDIAKVISQSDYATRLFQYEELLNNVLNEFSRLYQHTQLYLVLEDIDRAGESGIHFLETLAYFLRNSSSKCSLKVIVPISEESLRNERPAFEKALSHQYTFNPSIRDISKFFSSVLSKEIQLEAPWAAKFLSSFFMQINKDLTPKFTIRNMKQFLRNAATLNEKYSSQESRLSIWFIILEVSLNLSHQSNSQTVTFSRNVENMSIGYDLIHGNANTWDPRNPIHIALLVLNCHSFKSWDVNVFTDSRIINELRNGLFHVNFVPDNQGEHFEDYASFPGHELEDLLTNPFSQMRELSIPLRYFRR